MAKSMLLGESMLVLNGILGTTTGLACFLPCLREMSYIFKENQYSSSDTAIMTATFAGSCFLFGNGLYQSCSLLHHKMSSRKSKSPVSRMSSLLSRLRINILCLGVFELSAMIFLFKSDKDTNGTVTDLASRRCIDLLAYTGISLAASVYALKSIKLDVGNNSTGPSVEISLHVYKGVGSSIFKRHTGTDVEMRSESTPIKVDGDEKDPHSMASLVERLTKDRRTSDKFFIVLHGYNVSEEHASEMRKQLDEQLDQDQSGRILSFKFDWEGGESMVGFNPAWKSSHKCVAQLEALIRLMHTKGFKNLVLFAHSMGNVALVETVIKMLDPDNRLKTFNFENCQFISFASACFVDRFRIALRRLNGNYKRWTSYFHTGDFALMFEDIYKYIDGDVQGDVPMGKGPIYLEKHDNNLQKFESIDCSVLGFFDVESKKHSYYLHDSVLLDVAKTLFDSPTSSQPHDRHLKKIVNSKIVDKAIHNVHWEITKDQKSDSKKKLTNYQHTLKNRWFDKNMIQLKKPLILIVGVAAEEDGIKPGVVADVANIKSFFVNKKTCGFAEESVVTNEDSTFGNCVPFPAVKDFYNWCQNSISPLSSDACDSIIFYYSGHGNNDESKDTLQVAVRSDEADGTIAVRDIYNLLSAGAAKEDLPSKPVLMIIDACRGGKISKLDSVDTSVAENKESDLGSNDFDMISQSKDFSLRSNCMIINANTPSYMSMVNRYNRDKNGSVLTQYLTSFLSDVSTDLRFEMIDVRNKVSNYILETISDDDGAEEKMQVGQMVEMRETLLGPLYIGDRTHFEQVESRYLMKNPMVVVFGDVSDVLDKLTQLFRQVLNYEHVFRKNVTEFENLKDCVSFFKTDIRERLHSVKADGLIVIFSGFYNFKRNQVTMANGPDGQAKFGEIFKLFRGDVCAYLRKYPKVFVLNKRTLMMGFDAYQGEPFHYHPDGNILIVETRDCKSFIDTLIGSVKDTIDAGKQRYLREIIVDVRQKIKESGLEKAIEMIDTMSAPIVLTRNDGK